MKQLLNNITGIFDKISQIGVNKTDGNNQLLCEIKQRLSDLDKACDCAEKAFRIANKYVHKWSRQDRHAYNKCLEKFDKYD
jgi:hypothetical protein